MALHVPPVQRTCKAILVRCAYPLGPKRRLAAGSPPAAQTGCSFGSRKEDARHRQEPPDDDTANLRRLRTMPVADAPQSSGVVTFKLFRLAGGSGRFATVKSLSV